MLEKIKKIITNHEAKPIGNQRHFSVLLPLIQVKGEWHLLYEVRSKHISQPGETSFPGGAVEMGETYEEAAVRETMEELNLPRNAIQILGEMDFIVSEEAVIRSFVGELKDIDIKSIISNEEVEKLYTVPLSYFMIHDPDYFEMAVKFEHAKNFPFDRIPNGKQYKWRHGKQTIAFYQLQEQTLWGFTAGLTDRFIKLLKENGL
ncbi:CoA pyrophosphatase [Desemzia sp. C1]|uniref:NUDIX hydrolase n=1 Tax=Desemzia sp. C1 TaxID=2892016 RepID=UPI001E319C7F|nr:CoA pyrophosphatase [Desemzia sp. C1]MCI3029287.1 CoA pyrophosphatase [Desemzia sp. C1]